VALGVDRITGEYILLDVAKYFHLLICGASRWSKPVLLRCIMVPLLAKPKLDFGRFWTIHRPHGIRNIGSFSTISWALSSMSFMRPMFAEGRPVIFDI
jgi:hypothetical protein